MDVVAGEQILQVFAPLSSWLESIVNRALAPVHTELDDLRKQVSQRGEVTAPPGCLTWEAAKAKQFLSIRQASFLLNMSEKSVRRKIKQGIIASSKGLRHHRIPIEEIERYRKRTV